MKILKIFGIVAGIHVFALVLIFANPGCSSTSKPTPAPGDTVTRTDSPPGPSKPITMPDSGATPSSTAPISFNADPSTTGSTSGSRSSPTRPGSSSAATLATSPVSDVVPVTTYTVKAGDTLWELGKKYHIPYAEIAAANNLKTGAALQPGKKIIIPSRTSAVMAPTTSFAITSGKNNDTTLALAGSGSGGIKHIVKSGETLGGIARTYGVKQGDIAVANNIADPQKIRPGMELVIPGWQGPEKTSSKSGSAGGMTPKSTSAGSNMNKSGPYLGDSTSGAVTPNPNGDPPVIPVQESPMTPAPKSK